MKNRFLKKVTALVLLAMSTSMCLAADFQMAYSPINDLTLMTYLSINNTTSQALLYANHTGDTATVFLSPTIASVPPQLDLQAIPVQVDITQASSAILAIQYQQTTKNVTSTCTLQILAGSPGDGSATASYVGSFCSKYLHVDRDNINGGVVIYSTQGK